MENMYMDYDGENLTITMEVPKTQHSRLRYENEEYERQDYRDILQEASLRKRYAKA